MLKSKGLTEVDIEDFNNSLNQPPSYDEFKYKILHPKGGLTGGMTGLTYTMMSEGWPEDVIKLMYKMLCEMMKKNMCRVFFFCNG